MGFETHGKRKYLYLKVRRGRKVSSIYAGSGQFAQLCDQIVKVDRAEREEARQYERDEIERDRRAEQVIIASGRAVDARLRAALEQSGYHQHKRGEWRKTRVQDRAIQAAAPHKL